MIIRLILIIIFHFLPLLAFCQAEMSSAAHYLLSNAGMPHSLWNPAQEKGAETAICLRFQNHYSVADLNTLFLDGWIPAGTGSIGLCHINSGIPGYRRSSTGLSYTLPLSGEFNAGVRLDILLGGGKNILPAVDLGMTYELDARQRLGICAQIPVSHTATGIASGWPGICRFDYELHWAEIFHLISSLQFQSTWEVQPELLLAADFDEIAFAYSGKINPFAQSLSFLWHSQKVHLGMRLSYALDVGYSPELLLAWQK